MTVKPLFLLPGLHTDVVPGPKIEWALILMGIAGFVMIALAIKGAVDLVPFIASHI